MLVIYSKEEKESWGEGYQVLGWEWGMLLDWMISKGLTEKVTFDKDLKEVKEPAMLILGGNIPDRGNSQCKGPEVEAWLASLRNGNEASGAWVEWKRVEENAVGEVRWGWTMEGLADHSEYFGFYPGEMGTLLNGFEYHDLTYVFPGSLQMLCRV